MKMGFVIIAIGLIIVVLGIVMVVKSGKSASVPLASSEPPLVTSENLTIPLNEDEEKPTAIETETPEESPTPNAPQKLDERPQDLTAKEKGNAFEAYVADILKGSGIRIKQWNQGTITETGAMGENALNPDFYVEQPYGNSSLTYWLECKWRKKISGKYSFPPAQFERYKKTQHDSKRKVLIIFGIGGEPSNPGSVYIVPIDSIKDNSISQEALKQFYYSDLAKQLLPRISNYFREEVFRRSN